MPNANAHAERWVGSVRRECLEPFVEELLADVVGHRLAFRFALGQPSDDRLAVVEPGQAAQEIEAALKMVGLDDAAAVFFGEADPGAFPLAFPPLQEIEVRVGFVNSVVADFQGNPEPVASAISAATLYSCGQRRATQAGA
jgi:hypothetical protein